MVRLVFLMYNFWNDFSIFMKLKEFTFIISCWELVKQFSLFCSADHCRVHTNAVCSSGNMEEEKGVSAFAVADLELAFSSPQPEWRPLCADHVHPKGEEDVVARSCLPLHRASSGHSHDNSQEPAFPHQEGCESMSRTRAMWGPLSFGSSYG